MKGEIILKNVKRIISVITILALVAVMFSAVTLTTAAEDITYSGSVDLQSYISLTGTEDGSTDLKLAKKCIVGNGTDPGYHIVTTGETPELKSGSLVYGGFSAAIEHVRFGTSFSNFWWIGSVEFFGSSDGKNWSPITTERTVGGFNWPDANANSEVYDTASFTKEQNIRYLKVNLNNSALQAGLFSIEYACHKPSVEYANTVDYNGAFATEGTPLSHPESHYMYFADKGSFTFAAKDLAPITDFCAKLLLHIPSVSTSIKAQVSSDGINFKPVLLGLDKTAEFDRVAAWGCSSYDAYGSFTKEDNVRFIKLDLTFRIVCATGFYTFSYNTADMSDAFYANAFDMASAGTEEGNVIAGGASGGYLVAKDGAATEGSMIFYDENGISDFKAEYAQVFEAYGAIYFYASVDGETWYDVTGKDTDTGEIFAGDQNCHKHIFTTTLAPSKGYKYLKAFFKNGNAVGHFPVMFSVKYNNASQMGIEDPSEATSELKESYDVTVGANDESIVKTPNYDGAVFSSASVATPEIGSDYYAFYEGGASRSGTIDLYSDKVITDYAVDAFTGNMSIGGGQLEIYVSADGKTWVPTQPAGKSVYDPRGAWGDLAGAKFYGTLKESANIHYIRIKFTTAWLAFLPAVKNISYNYVSIEESDYEMCDGHENSINSANATTKTPYVEGAELRDAGGAAAGYNAFFDASGAWQTGEIVFHSAAAITDYCVEAICGNISGYGIIKLYASADGVNYTLLNPKKETYQVINPDWGEVKHNYFYGKIFASADIHYLKVEYAERGAWIGEIPAVRNFHFNTVETCNNLGHQYGAPVTVPATCTKEGSTTTTCARCGHVNVETIGVIDHSFTEYVSDGNATPTTDGTKTAYCDYECGTHNTIADEGSRFDCIYEDVADSDGNGEINAVDYTAFRKVLMNEEEADLNGDGVTDILDLIRLKKFILNSVSDPEINVDSPVVDAPENMD